MMMMMPTRLMFRYKSIVWVCCCYFFSLLCLFTPVFPSNCVTCDQTVEKQTLQTSKLICPNQIQSMLNFYDNIQNERIENFQ